MQSGSSLRDHEETFDSLVQSLSAIGKDFDDEELIILFANSLPSDVFGNWIQTQMALIDDMSLIDFKSRVREETHRLISVGQGQSLGIDSKDSDVQGNLAKGNSPFRMFPQRKPNPSNIVCYGCGEKGHIKNECPSKRIAEEYIAKQVAKLAANQGQGPQGGQQGHRRKKGKGGGDGNQQPQRNVANADNSKDSNDSTSAYSAIFGGLAYCCKAATNC